MSKHIKSAAELEHLIREELGPDVDVDKIFVYPDRELGWRATCVGKPLTAGGFQYIVDRITERLRTRYDLHSN